MPRRYPDIGLAAPEKQWVPSPSYLLRRAAIFDVLEGLPPGRVLEVGCSAGALLHDLGDRGYTGVGVELSDRARAIAEELLGDDDRFVIDREVPANETEGFDLLLAFEVLEHIEDDRAALESWVRLLAPSGRVVISVPAHRHRWTWVDAWAGHYRRYDRRDVVALLEGAGLRIETLWTIGWPASWLIERVRNLAKTAQARREGFDFDAARRGDAAGTEKSGIDRSLETRLFPFYSTAAGRLCLRGAARVQRRFYGTDLGISYLAVATKRAA